MPHNLYSAFKVALTDEKSGLYGSRHGVAVRFMTWDSKHSVELLVSVVNSLLLILGAKIFDTHLKFCLLANVQCIAPKIAGAVASSTLSTPLPWRS